MAKIRIDARQLVTNRILAQLEQGVVPWRQPWNVGAGMLPQSGVTHKPYRGINRLLLGMSDYGDPRWFGFSALAERGGSVVGQKGTKIVKVLTYTYKKAGDVDEDGDQVERAGRSLRILTVFNAEQITGLNLDPIKVEEFDPIQRAEEIIEYMPSPPSISYGGARAYYKPSADHVKVPVRGSYSPATEFYSTMFHELGHSTGHPSRLNRFGPDAKTAPFGTPEYSREELVAEFTAAYLCQMSGIDNTLDLSASYLANWSKVLRNDKTMLIAGASRGSAAADYIVGQSDAV